MPTYILATNTAPLRDIVTTTCTAYEKQFVVICGDANLLYL